MQEKISISIDRELVRKVDKLVDGITIKKRSQSFETIIRKYFSATNIKKAIILLGKQSKLNKSFCLNNLKKLEEISVRQVIIAAGGHNKDVSRLIENEKLNLNVSYLDEAEPKGTAGVIKLAQSILDSTFLVMAGDTLFDFDLKSIVEFHDNNDNLATIGLTTIALNKSTDNITVEGNRVVSFEYKGNVQTYLTNAGIYIFDPKILNYLPEKGSLEKEVLPKLSKENKLNAFLLDNKMVKII